MAKLQVLEYTVGMAGTNCYFLVNTDTKETIIVDPGDSAPLLMQRIREQDLKPVAIFLTHAHFDHAHDAKTLKDEYNIPVYAHEAEAETMTNPQMNASGMFGASETYDADIWVKDGQELTVAGFRIRVIFTPGHTPGGVCYYLPEEKALFCGDTLFCGSIGRTDFPGGSTRQLLKAIREKLLTLPRDTVVYPGHMGRTTIGEEANSNPFL